MSYGIEPTQREEWRKKKRVRLFFDHRLMEIQDLILYTLHVLALLYDLIYYLVVWATPFLRLFWAHSKKFFTENRNYTIMVLFMIVVLIVLFS